MPEVLPREYYLRPVLEVARGLIGQTLVHETEAGRISGRIVETEAYHGEEDRASHARAGRTARTELMYGEGGHVYIYLAYGLYWMFNLTAEPADSPAAVLIRAVEPQEGEDLMLANRLRGSTFHKVKRAPNEAALRRNLASGPARLALAYGLSRDQNGLDATRPPLYVERGVEVGEDEIEASPRIGVAYAGEWAAHPWRFTLRESPALSR